MSLWQLEQRYPNTDNVIAKNTYSAGAMELRQACFAVPFYRRITPDLVGNPYTEI